MVVSPTGFDTTRILVQYGTAGSKPRGGFGVIVVAVASANPRPVATPRPLPRA